MKHGRKLVLPLIATFFFLAIYPSCKKNEPKTAAASKNETRLVSGKTVRNQSWLELRDQAKEEFGFYFGAYYHTRDFLGNLDWEHAILDETDGVKTMVFLFQTSYADKIDAKLMVRHRAITGRTFI